MVAGVRRLVLVVGILGSLAVAGPAQGATTIGAPDMQDVNLSGSVGCSVAATCVFTQVELRGDPAQAEVPSAGVITSYSVRHASGSVRLQVYRGASLDRVATTADANHLGGDTIDTTNVRVPVAAGDLIGVRLAVGSKIGIYGGEPSNGLYEGSDTNPLGVGVFTNEQLLLSAVVEPDADRDGLGDESQDPDGGSPPPVKPKPPVAPDPLAALKAGKLPAIAVAGKAFTASKSGAITIPVSNPATGYAVSGAITLKAGKAKIGSARYSLPAGGKKTVKVKLAKKARAALKRRRKVKATASISVEGPVGRTATVKRKITIKPPPKKKKNARRPAGGNDSYVGTTVRFSLAGGKVTGFTGNAPEFFCQSSRGNSYFDAPLTFTDKDAVKPSASGKFSGSGVGIDHNLNDGEPEGGRIYRFGYTGTLLPGGRAKGTFTVTYDYSRARLNQNGIGGYLDRVFCRQTLVWTAR